MNENGCVPFAKTLGMVSAPNSNGTQGRSVMTIRTDHYADER